MTNQLSEEIISSEFMIPSDTPGINLFVRNKRRSDLEAISADKTLLFVSGSTYPASASFDLALDGYSWMDHLAANGYNTYLVDVRGYGRSDLPSEMTQPAMDNAPIVRTPVAVRDVTTAAEFVRSRTGNEKINLIGWSWGTTLMARYTAANNDAVRKLVLVAPQWIRETPSLADAGGPLGAYRTVDRLSAKARWIGGIPEDQQEKLLPTAWFNAWADANFGTADGDRNGTGEVLAPNGTVLDSREFWASGKSLYEPSEIKVPVLIVHADYDKDCPLDMSRTVFSKLTKAPYRRWVEIGGGTHSAFMETNRWQIFGAVQTFLDENPPELEVQTA
jgi:pimeloyl-ACP methyl ester carboxylesterase